MLSFNLVIEDLIFSSMSGSLTIGCTKKFQSRNRGSYLFKSGRNWTLDWMMPKFQSRNRESYLFKPYALWVDRPAI